MCYYALCTMLLISMSWASVKAADWENSGTEIHEKTDRYICDQSDQVGLVKEGYIIDCLYRYIPKVLGVKMSLHPLYPENTGSPFVPSDLDCTFDKVCEWRNAVVPDLIDVKFYKVTKGKPDADKLNILTGYSGTPDPPFALLSLVASSSGSKAWLVSKPIPTQTGIGSLKFRYWITPLAVLRICTRPAFSATLNGCQNVTSVDDSVCSTTKVGKIEPPIDQPFEIVFEVTAMRGGIMMLDDIEYTVAN